MSDSAQPESSLTDCEQVRHCSLYVRQWIEKQPEVKEESLTDWLLFELSLRIPRIRYKSFSRHEESRVTGADWHWWFVFDRFSFQIRVQAKRLKASGNSRPAILYPRGTCDQITKLIDDAKTHNYLPLYAFYAPGAPTVMCGRKPTDEGVYLAGALRVFGASVAKTSTPLKSASLLAISNPLSCLICCPYTSGPDGLLAFITAYYGSEIPLPPDGDPREGEDGPPRIPGYHAEAPAYVQRLLHREDSPEYWEGKREALGDMRALVVYDGRGLKRQGPQLP